MRALVTGNAGFIGRNFTRRLRADGWDVVGFDIATGTDARHVLAPGGFYDGRFYDLCVHAAAVVGGRESIDGDPLGVAQNLGIDQVAMSWALRTATPLLYFSSSAVYPVGMQAAPGYPLTEDHLKVGAGKFGTPDQTYGWSKLTGEVLAYHARSRGARITIVRPFSGYGEDQDRTYPFPAFIDRAKALTDPFPVWGSGRQVRDFIHVDDVYDAAMAVVASGDPHPVNLCSGQGISFRTLAQLVCDLAGYAPEFEFLPHKPSGVAFRVGDPTLMRRYHQPKVPLEEGIRRALLAPPF